MSKETIPPLLLITPEKVVDELSPPTVKFPLSSISIVPVPSIEPTVIVFVVFNSKVVPEVISTTVELDNAPPADNLNVPSLIVLLLLWYH